MQMITLRCACALLGAMGAVTAASADSASSASKMHVPAGFVIEPIALPPLVQRPMMGGFDERGRLFVTESAGVNLAYDKLRETPPNSIRMLEDTDGDGTFDKSTIFAD